MDCPRVAFAEKMMRNKLRRIFFFIMRRDYKRTRRHKCGLYKHLLHVNNHKIDQEKQNKTVARWKLMTTETSPRFRLLIQQQKCLCSLKLAFLKYCRKLQEWPKSARKRNPDLLENALTYFSLILHTSCVGTVVQIVQVSS